MLMEKAMLVVNITITTVHCGLVEVLVVGTARIMRVQQQAEPTQAVVEIILWLTTVMLMM
jgi:hypothetical protein